MGYHKNCLLFFLKPPLPFFCPPEVYRKRKKGGIKLLKGEIEGKVALRNERIVYPRKRGAIFHVDLFKGGGEVDRKGWTGRGAA